MALGRINIDDSVFFLCDIQEKFKLNPKFQEFGDILVNSTRLVACSKILEVPLVVSEQYPKGLGTTCDELDIAHADLKFEKTAFTMWNHYVEAYLKNKSHLRCVILFGVETHVCVQQTALDLLANKYEVIVVADCTSSRSSIDRKFSFERMKQAGAIISTSESVIFQLLADKEHPKFKEILNLIKEIGLPAGLHKL